MNIYIKAIVRSWASSKSQLSLHDYIDKYVLEAELYLEYWGNSSLSFSIIGCLTFNLYNYGIIWLYLWTVWSGLRLCRLLVWLWVTWLTEAIQLLLPLIGITLMCVRLGEVLRVWSISSSTMPKRTNSSSSCKRLECSRQFL